jgi:hypothetical protein
MAAAGLIIRKQARGVYEIGIRTDDGSVVAVVSVWDGAARDERGEAEREVAALAKASRLARAFDEALNTETGQ